MPEPALLYEKRDGIASVMFNRPEARNPISPEVSCRLADAWQDYEADDSLRVAILTGVGERAFSARADMRKLIPLYTGARQPEDDWDRRVLEDKMVGGRSVLRRFPPYKPTSVANDGFCLAVEPPS